MLGEDCIMKSFIICTLHQTLLGGLSRRTRWARYLARIGEIQNCTNLLLENLKGIVILILAPYFV
jgi:hypothetical protein